MLFVGLLSVGLLGPLAVGELGAQWRRELRVGVLGLPLVVDPIAAITGPGPLVASHVFDTLVAYRPHSTDIEPALATRWAVSRDGLVWTFSLREHRFHDGHAVTAFDVVTSLERHLRPEDLQTRPGIVWGPLLRGVPGVVRDVRARDPRTVEVRLTQPYAPLLTVLAHPGFAIVRRTTGPDGSPRLVGSGPFRIVDSSPGRLALELVPGHWRPAPRSERIVLLEIAGDEQAEAALDNRTLDIWLPPAAPRRTDGAISAPGLTVGYLAFQTEKEPFSRRAIRHAMAAALEPGVLGAALENAAVPLLSFLPTAVWARREGTPVIGGGQENAKRLLTEGGWPSGFKPTLLVALPEGTPDPARLGETLEQLLGAADIPVQVRREAPEVARAVLEAGDYELALTEASVAGGDPHLFLYPLSTSESAAKGPRALNYSYYRNPRLDDMLIRASQLGFRPERERLYLRVQATLISELPWVPIYVRLHWAVTRPEVRGLRLHPTGFHRLDAVELEPRAWP